MSGQFDPGCIRIRLALEDGRVRDVEVASDRPAVASVLRGKQADAAVRLVPLLFALCGKAQGQAAELALAAARGTASAPRLVPAIAAEAMREHLWRCLIDLPPLLGDEAFKPEFSVAAVAVANDRRDQVGAVLADSRIAGLMRRFGHRADIEAAAQHFLPDLDALATLALWPRLDASFCRRPVWRGRAAETGALARRRNAAGSGLSRYWHARMDELVEWAGNTASIGAAGTASSIQVAPGIGRGVVETARGLLMHEIVLEGDRIGDYFIVAPTEWNFHPDGPLGGWLKGREASGGGEFQKFVARAMAALDPCVRWELDGL